MSMGEYFQVFLAEPLAKHTHNALDAHKSALLDRLITCGGCSIPICGGTDIACPPGGERSVCLVDFALNGSSSMGTVGVVWNFRLFSWNVRCVSSLDASHMTGLVAVFSAGWVIALDS